MDYPVWPLFIVQIVALFLVLFCGKRHLFGVRVKTLSITLLLLVCVGISISLMHDSSDVLQLSF